jgi:hypothetical protein
MSFTKKLVLGLFVTIRNVFTFRWALSWINRVSRVAWARLNAVSVTNDVGSESL